MTQQPPLMFSGSHQAFIIVAANRVWTGLKWSNEIRKAAYYSSLDAACLNRPGMAREGDDIIIHEVTIGVSNKVHSIFTGRRVE